MVIILFLRPLSEYVREKYFGGFQNPLSRLSFTELKNELHIKSNSSLSHHLTIIQDGGLIENRLELGKDKHTSYYTATDLAIEILRSLWFRYSVIPHIRPGTIAYNRPPEQEILYDRPQIDKSIIRISGTFTVEAVPSLAGINYWRRGGSCQVLNIWQSQGVVYQATSQGDVNLVLISSETLQQILDKIKYNGILKINVSHQVKPYSFSVSYFPWKSSTLWCAKILDYRDRIVIPVCNIYLHIILIIGNHPWSVSNTYLFNHCICIAIDDR